MRVFIGITDDEWFAHLSQLKIRLESAGDQLDEINFWQPGGNRQFKVLREGELLLFKLHSPNNFIVGGGVFARSSLLPSSLAWEAFREKNGAASFPEMQRRIVKYRREGSERASFTIGCILLQSPFFLQQRHWIPMPEGFPLNAVQGKGYDSNDPALRPILEHLEAVGFNEPRAAEELPGPMFSEPRPVRQRLGQGIFRIMILDAFERRCAVTGEKTLPTLEAAHIRPVASGGRHATDNGLLLRSDVHRLYDAGYVTVTTEFRFRVSDRIKKEFDNGEEYYALSNSPIRLPADPSFHPRKELLEWHADTCFLG